MQRKQKMIDMANKLELSPNCCAFCRGPFEKGVTQDLLLEAGVFLVSAKMLLVTTKIEWPSRALNGNHYYHQKN